MGDIDFDSMNWGSFKKQFQASKKKLGVSSLEAFANHILDNPKGFRDTTKKRANFYKNVILKKKGGSKPSEDDLLDEFMGSFADERTAEEKAQEKAADDRKRENDELIRNMPTQPHLNRYVFPTLRPPHIAEQRIYNTPVVRDEYIPELEERNETSELVRRYKEVQDREKKGGMMQVSDDESDDDMDGAGKKKAVKAYSQKNKITDTFKDPKSIMEISKRLLRERDAGIRDANLETEEDKEKARAIMARNHDRLKEWRRKRDIRIPQDELTATIPDDGTQEGGRFIRSHIVRPFFAMN